MNDFFGSDQMTTLEAKYEAQKIAFAPFIFQVARVMRDFNILKIIEAGEDKGVTFAEIEKQVDLSEYSLKLILDSSLSIGLLRMSADHFVLTKTGYFILNDKITNINIDFVHDVCYQGIYFLDQSFKEGKPAGLKTLGNWETIYDGLAELEPKVKESWFKFDHYFSDNAFQKVLPIIFKEKPGSILDVGGNTGKWAIACAQYSADTTITIIDLPGQLQQAKINVEKSGYQNRIAMHAMNILDPSQPIPGSYPVVWMSQFLDCFSKKDIVSILKKVKQVMSDSSLLYILETYPDRQRYEVASFCLDMTSLYFTCMANGRSRMYHSADLKECLEKAGFLIETDRDGISLSHTLFICRKK